MSWDKLGLPKNDGGLGFRKFQDFNDALLAKQCWRLIHNLNSLWAWILKARYCPHTSFLDVKLGSRASWAWESLLACYDVLKVGTHWQILNGRDTYLWVDRWLPSLPLGHPDPRCSNHITLNIKVSFLICQNTRMWEIKFLRPLIFVEEFNAIRDTLLGHSSRWDMLIWSTDRCGKYSIRLGYH